MKPALLVIDVQKAFFETPRTAESLNQAIEYINLAIELFRERDLPVICVQHMDPVDQLIPGQPGFDLPESLNILSTDLHFHKTYGNAFNKTSLEVHIREMGVDTLILCGYCAEYCVLSTSRGAEDLDFTPIMLQGGLASSTPEHIHFVEEISDIISYGALKKFLEPRG